MEKSKIYSTIAVFILFGAAIFLWLTLPRIIEELYPVYEGTWNLEQVLLGNEQFPLLSEPLPVFPSMRIKNGEVTFTAGEPAPVPLCHGTYEVKDGKYLHVKLDKEITTAENKISLYIFEFSKAERANLRLTYGVRTVAIYAK